ncbi:unnamed protein product, partial [Rotaria magnacalcarata]
VSTEQRSRTNQLQTPLNLDEILENITKIQYPSPMKHNLITSSSMPQKSSDILYLIIGIIAGVLLILIMILIA